MEGTGSQQLVTAREAGLVACRRCARVWPLERETCARCGTRLESRDWRSLQRVWAWLTVGIICYIPANLYPMLKTQVLFDVSEATIIEGAVELATHGNLGVAAISQFYIPCKNDDEKYENLTNLYGCLNVGQSVIFVNSRNKA